MSLDLTFPRRLYVEMYLSGAWRPVGQHVMQSPDITIGRGIPDQSDEAPPAWCTFTLNDSAGKGNGDYNPNNPTGQWYGQLTRNVPVRTGLEVGEDAFTRSVGSGWGTSPANGAWSASGTGTFATSVSSNEGRHSITTTNATAFNYLGTVLVRDVEVAVSATINSVSDVTGGALSWNVMLRGQSTSTYYLCNVEVSSAEVVTLRVIRTDSGVPTTIASVALPTVYSGQQWRIKAQSEGRTIRLKAWPAAGAEPLDFQLTAVDPARTALPAGWVGVFSAVTTANSNAKPVLFRYDDLELRVPRFEGEATRMTPDADQTMTLRTTAVRCSDIVQRLSQGRAPVKSPMTRVIPVVAAQSKVFAYYPMEEEKFATSIASGLPNVEPMRVLYGALNAKFGESTEFPGSNPLPLIGTTQFRATLPAHTVTGKYSWGALINIPGGQDDTAIFVMELLTSGSACKWHVQLEQDGSLSVRAFGTGTSGLVLDDTANAVATDIPMFITLSLNQVGGDIDYAVNYTLFSDDPVVFHSYTGGTLSGYTLGTAAQMSVIGGVPDLGFPGPSGVTVGQLQVANGIGVAFGDFQANIGERLADRMNRLAGENDIPDVAELYTDTTSDDTMGYQRSDTLLNLIRECARTGHGILFTPKGARTFAYRKLDTLYDQTPLVTLDHSTGVFQPGFKPVSDDFAPRNDVTVQRRDGGSAQAVREEGQNNALNPGTADGAVGRYDTTYTVNCESDDQAAYSAGWLLHLGTVAEPRFPEIPIDLAGNALRDEPDMQAALLDCGPGDVMAITNLEKWGLYEDAEEMVLGYTERFNTTFRHVITFNVTPAKPYTVGALDDGALRLDLDSTLAEDLDATETSIDVTTSDPFGTIWATTAGLPAEFPFDVMVGGERVRVGGCTGSGPAQTFTGCTRSVNGVVKTHLTGARISLADPDYVPR